MTEEKLTVDGLRKYKIQNPVKFKLKFGDIDLDSVESDFNINLYKYQVTQERVRREKRGASQDLPITPDMFEIKQTEVEIDEADSEDLEDSTEKEEVEVEVEKKVEKKPAKNVKGGKTLKAKTK